MWRNWFRLFSTFLMFGVLFAGCAASEPRMASFDMAAEESAPAFEADRAFDGDVAGGSGESQLDLPDQAERLIIRSGTLSLVVENPEASADDIAAAVAELGGWVVESNIRTVSSSSGTKRGTVNVRVPAERFDEALERFKADAIEITSESVSGQDVTEEFVDLNARLRTQQATQERVRSFLDDADTVEEALEVNRELARLDEEIERLTARIQFLSQSAAFSSIRIELTADEDVQPIEVGRWRPQGTALRAVESLIGFLQGLVDFLIQFVILWLPVLLVLFVALWLISRTVRWLQGRGMWPRLRRQARAAAPAEAESDESA